MRQRCNAHGDMCTEYHQPETAPSRAPPDTSTPMRSSGGTAFSPNPDPRHACGPPRAAAAASRALALAACCPAPNPALARNPLCDATGQPPGGCVTGCLRARARARPRAGPCMHAEPGCAQPAASIAEGALAVCPGRAGARLGAASSAETALPFAGCCRSPCAGGSAALRGPSGRRSASGASRSARLGSQLRRLAPAAPKFSRCPAAGPRFPCGAARSSGAQAPRCGAAMLAPALPARDSADDGGAAAACAGALALPVLVPDSAEGTCASDAARGRRGARGERWRGLALTLTLSLPPSARPACAADAPR